MNATSQISAELTARTVDSLAQHHWIVYHIAWKVAGAKLILREEVADACRDAFNTSCESRNWELLYAQIRPSSVQLAVRVTPKDSPSNVAAALRQDSSRRLRDTIPLLRNLRSVWDRDFCASTATHAEMQMIAHRRVHIS